MTAKEELDQFLQAGPMHDILEAEQALAIMRAIARARGELLRTRHALPFKIFQNYSLDALILAVTRLFDVKRGYPLRSLPEAINLFKSHAEELRVAEPALLRPPLEMLGLWSDSLEQLSERDRVIEIARLLQTKLPAPKSHPALDALKASRDKVLAHREAIEQEEIPNTTWNEAEQLIHIAQRIVAVLAAGYCSFFYMFDDGKVLLTEDADIAGHAIDQVIALVIEYAKR